MDIDLYFPCDRCGAMPLYGEFVMRAELRRSDRHWTTSKTIERRGLCLDCFGDFAEATAVAALGLPDPARPGLPAPVDAAPSDFAHCNFCRSSLPAQAVGIDLVPMTMALVRRALFKHVGSIQQHRLCRQCVTWCLTLLHVGSGESGRHQRAHEGGLATWRQDVARDAWTAGLIARDEQAVGEIAWGAGRDWAPIGFADARLLPYEPARVAFMAAGQGRAERAVRMLAESDRSRVVVVARPDTIDEAMEVLRLGAGDLLVSPLSEEQVAGAFERVAEAHLRQRHRDTGLTIYGNSEPGAHELPSNTIQVDLPRTETVPGTVLRLRRFIRGYDRVGVDTAGGVRVVVYCPSEHAPIVIERVKVVLGEGSNLKVVARGEPKALPAPGAQAGEAAA